MYEDQKYSLIYKETFQNDIHKINGFNTLAKRYLKDTIDHPHTSISDSIYFSDVIYQMESYDYYESPEFQPILDQIAMHPVYVYQKEYVPIAWNLAYIPRAIKNQYAFSFVEGPHIRRALKKTPAELKKN